MRRHDRGGRYCVPGAKVIGFLLLFAGILCRPESLAADTIPEIVAKAKPAVVQVIAFDRNRSPIRTGTGFFISGDGFLLTNNHVIAGASYLSAITSSGAIYIFESVIVNSIDPDLAVLKFAATDVPHLELGSSADAVEGERVLVIGNPEGLQGTVSDGIISAFRDDRAYIQITAPISPGSSGSPVLDESGQVIGMATLGYRGGENLNFAISSGTIRTYLISERNKTQTEVTPPQNESQQDTESLSEHTQQVVKTFVENFIVSGEANDPAERNKFYAPVVDQFYEHRHFTRQQIAESDRAYREKWPIRHYRPNEDTFRVVDLGSDFQVTGLFDWWVSNGSKTLRGSSVIRVRIEATSQDELQIIDVDERVQK
jgi:Trypsin-like peptidase domain